MSLEQEREFARMRERIAELRELSEREGIEMTEEIRELEEKLDAEQAESFAGLSRYDRVKLARHQERPFTLEYVERLLTDWIELQGDRRYRNDPSIVGGWGSFRGRTVMLIGHQKGRDMKENLNRNFGSPHPEGYRKAQRLMRLAEKFARPVITLIDTQGAYPGIGAEERGQAEAIARSLSTMAGLRTPIVSCVIGEGGSGGALGIGLADRILMMENAIYSVISPEGCAAILWRSRDQAAEAAEALKLTAADLQEHEIVDEVVAEPPGGAHARPAEAADEVGKALARHLQELEAMDPEELLERRRRRYYGIGRWEEASA